MRHLGSVQRVSMGRSGSVAADGQVECQQWTTVRRTTCGVVRRSLRIGSGLLASLGLLAGLGAMSSVARAATIYVRTTGDDANDGLSWANAKQTVTAATAAAIDGDQVWVAEGTYVQHLTLWTGVALYGGFAGHETLLEQRDWVAHPTILDAKQQGFVVVVYQVASGNTRIDGFTIRGGSVGGIFCAVSSPTIANNTITENGASNAEGGIYCVGPCSPIIVHNQITANRAGGGGGIRCTYDTAPFIANNLILRNQASVGGGINCDLGSAATIINNTVVGNFAEHEGGGIFCVSAAATITNNTIVGNTAETGGGVRFLNASALFRNNLVAFNSTGIYVTGAAPTLEHNCVYGSYVDDYIGVSPGASDLSADPGLVAKAYGETHLQAGSPCIDAGLDDATQPGWVDMDGEPRVQGAHVDIGADEYNGTPPVMSPPKVIRVSPSGDDAQDGSSWALAKRTVQAGIDAAAATGGDVWVAAGTYHQRITLKLWVHVYGGFAGVEEFRDQRDWVQHVTILDGDAGGSVVTAPPGSGVSCIDGFTIRNGSGTEMRSDLCGGGVFCSFAAPIITNNVITENRPFHPRPNGGGIYCTSSWPVISRNVISFNYGLDGGGVYCASSWPVIAGNRITSNGASGYGGGIYCIGSSPVMTNNVIRANYGGWGSGLYCKTSTLRVVNNTIVLNGNQYGVVCWDSPGTLANNLVAFNSSGIYVQGVAPQLQHNCVYGSAGGDYSGIEPGGDDISTDPRLLSFDYGDVHLKADSPCIDAGTDSLVEPGAMDFDGEARIQGVRVDIGADEFNGVTPALPVPTIIRVSPTGDDAADGSSWAQAKQTVQAGIDAASLAGGGEVWVAAGTYNQPVLMSAWTHVYGGFAGDEISRQQRDWRSQVTILDAEGAGSVVSAGVKGVARIDGFTIRNGHATQGGGIYCPGTWLTIANDRIIGNVADVGGGGIYSFAARTVITDNLIAGNVSRSLGGGGIYTDRSTIVNNAIIGNVAESVGNVAESGGGIYCIGSSDSLVVDNCTLVGNSAQQGAGLFAYWGRIANCVIWANSGVDLNASSGSRTVVHCDIEGGSPGEGNLDVDPLFVRLPGPGTDGAWGTDDDDYGDLRLRAGSPCIDAGSNAAVPADVLVDLDGSPRFLDDPATPDCRWAPGTCGAAPIVDMGAYEFMAGDYDYDGDVDADDLAAFQACVSGPMVGYSGDCLGADLDRDGDVDNGDFGVFQRCFRGAKDAAVAGH